MGSRASRVNVISGEARPGWISGLRGSHGGEVVLARRCMMTDGESTRVSPHGAARVNGLSTRLIDGLRSALTRKRRCTISPKARRTLRGATDRRPVNESSAMSCAARSETAHSSDPWIRTPRAPGIRRARRQRRVHPNRAFVSA
jgi:hypothetical protein